MNSVVKISINYMDENETSKTLKCHGAFIVFVNSESIKVIPVALHRNGSGVR